MGFVQVIEFRTDRADELLSLDQQWRDATAGKRTLRRSVFARDRNDPDRYVVLAFFDSYEDAMKNSNLPETGEFANKLAALSDTPVFSDFDVVEDQT
jgi:hypothetical protein